MRSPDSSEKEIENKSLRGVLEGSPLQTIHIGEALRLLWPHA